jgi:hypothetical protein
MTEGFDHLTDADYEAIGAIVEGSERRAMGEHLLRVAEGAEQQKREQGRALLDAIAQARLEQEAEQE